jgi:hypothetical protein
MIAVVKTHGLLHVFMGAAMIQAQPFVPGEVLIRFVAGSEGRQATRKSVETSPPNFQLLAGVTAALGERVDTPLRAVRVGGGEWLLLRVHVDDLARRTADRLARCRRVARATRDPGDSAKAVIHTTFQPGSSEARLLARAGQPDGKAQLDSLITDVARRIHTPLKAAVSGEELLIEVDLEALTLQLVERLKALPDIESAQPNFRMRAFGPRSS